MIDHPEDYAGPTEPCGDLSAAPFGGGEPDERGLLACVGCGVPAGDGHAAACPVDGAAQAPGWTGAPPGLLQDDCAGLSKALASKPDAMRHAREAAQAIRTLPNCAVECEVRCQMSTRGYCERPRRPLGGWSDSGSQEGV